LQNEYRKLWVFGDSYTTPSVCVEPKDSFWGLTAVELGINTVVNCSRPVNSFGSVQQLVIGMRDQIDWQHDLVLIGVPPLERITVFDDHKDTSYLAHQIDTQTWKIETFDVACHRGLIGLQNYGTDRRLILHSDRSWLETDVLRQIFLLTQWLDGLAARYLILNLSKDLDRNNRWGPSEPVLDYCINHPRTILFEKTYHGINIGVNKPADSDTPEGHHGPAGNRYFFDKSLLPKLKACGLC
jgi:hypothetical protein